MADEGSFYAYLSNKNYLPEWRVPGACTRLPAPINSFESKYEFALLHLEITERWENIGPDPAMTVYDLGKDPSTLSYTELKTITALPSNYCGSPEEFNNMMRSLFNKTTEPWLEFEWSKKFADDHIPPQAMIHLKPRCAFIVSPGLMKAMQLPQNTYSNRELNATRKIPYTFDPVQERFLYVVSPLAPLSYALNRTLNVLATIWVDRAPADRFYENVFAIDISNPVYVSCQRGMLDIIEVKLLDHNGEAIRPLKGTVITCTLHFRKISSADRVVSVVKPKQ